MSDFAPGARIGRYQLLFPIAEGGMAQVYAARYKTEVGFRKLVALKRMLPHLADDQDFVSMFLDEGRIAANISSPHVVTTLDLGRAADQSLYLVMELVIGVSLEALMERLVKRGQATPPEIGLRILLDAATGLHDAHQATTATGAPLHLIHRDVSPHNILVGADGRARLTDFGVARAVQRITTTMIGQIKGKTAYMSPEQAATTDIDQRCDIFSLGVVAWELFSLRRLFYAPNHIEALQKVLLGPIPSLDQLMPGFPSGAAKVVARALQRNRDVRFSAACDLAEAIQGCGVRVATPRELGAFLRTWMGDEVSQLEERIRVSIETVTDAPSALQDEVAGEKTIVSPMQFDIEELRRLAPARPDEVTSVIGGAPEGREAGPRWVGRALLIGAVVLLAAGVGSALALLEW